MLAALALVSAGILVTVWVAYPGVMAMLARGRRSSAVARPAWTPEVTIVLATREPAEVVRGRIENCLDTDYPAERLGIVVARDWAAPAAESEFLAGAVDPARVRVVAGDEPGGKAATLNAGVRAAPGGVVVFADAHQRFRRDTVPHLVAALGAPGVGAVSGRLDLPERRSLVTAYWAFERALRRNEAAVHSTVGATGAVWAIRKELWNPLPSGLLLDDLYAPMKVVLSGARVAYAADARAIETRSPTPLQEYGRKVRTLTGVLQLCAWLPAVLDPFRNPIWPQFVAHKLLRMLTPYCVALIAVWAAARGLPSLGRSFPYLVAAGGIAALWLTRTRSRLGGRIRRLALEGTLLQAAVIVAGFNGFRRHWRVWDA